MKFPIFFLGVAAALATPLTVAAQEQKTSNVDLVLDHIASVNVALFANQPIDVAAKNLNKEIRVSVQMQPGSPVETSTDIRALQGIYDLFTADGTELLGGHCEENVVSEDGTTLSGLVSCALEGSDGRGGRKTFQVIYGLHEGKIRYFLLLGPRVVYVPNSP